MAKQMTEQEWQQLYENFETFDLLTSVDRLDQVRYRLADGDNLEPPQIRTELMNLHQLAMEVVNQGRTDKAEELFELADELDIQVFEMIENLGYIQDVLMKLTVLAPELD